MLRQSPADKAAVIGAGITLHEALKAYEELKSQGIAIRVIDLYCVKPLDGKALAEQLRASAGKLVTVEDHYAQGGLGEGVVTELLETGAAPARYKRLAVEGMPHSGKPEELVDAFGISSRHIVEAVKGIVS
ncbi:MAG: transketolase C-terminal domain-containing protein [Candidatus Acidiferrales bacterium]